MLIMEALGHLLLKSLRKAYFMTFIKDGQKPLSDQDISIDEASDIVYHKLMDDNPCMIARFGAFEFSMVLNYLSITSKHHSVIKFIKGEEAEWWWDSNKMYYMKNNAGFFPADEEHLARFCQLMQSDAKYVDILGSWRLYEDKLIDTDAIQCVRLVYLEPFHSSRPWSRALDGKRVLVIHPFAEMIESQYKNHREQLFSNKDVLPPFHLSTIPAVQSLGGQNSGFKDWFEALQWMKDEIDKQDYDIALIGCGAYGFHLAAHVKRKGKKAVHLGGSLQLLFGIRGKRWDNPLQGSGSLGEPGRYLALFNEHWIYPDKRYRPANAQQVEGGCYW